jgi:very-short-patch-repair endonuclease
MRKELHIQTFAAGREGIMRHAELIASGLTPPTITARLRAGRLWRRYQGVYVVGKRELTREGEFLAAVLAIGDDAALGYFAGAAHYGFLNWHGGPIDVVVARRVRSRPGLRVRNVKQMPPTNVHRGIPVTTVEQTIVDLAAVMKSQRAFERLIHEALVQKLTDERRIRAHVAAMTPRSRGVNRVLKELEDGAKPTRSGLEDAAVNVLRRHRFPHFETDAHPPGTPEWVEVDVIFPAQRLILEIDGDRWHDTPFRRRFDARKQALLEAAGYRVLRLAEGGFKPEAEAATVGRIWEELRQTRLLELA